MEVDTTPFVNSSAEFERPGLSYEKGRYSGFDPFFAGNKEATLKEADWNWISLYWNTFQSQLQAGAASTARYSSVYTAALYDTTLTQGSVVFAGAGGLLSQNNASFFWDNATGRLGLGNAIPSVTLDVTGSAKISANLTLSAMTANRVVYTGAAGLLSSDGNLTYSSSVLNAVQQLRVGTAVDTAAQGDFAAGFSGATRLYWDTTNVNLSIFGTAPVAVLGDTGGGRASIRFNRSSTVKSIVGLAGSASDLVPGSAAGDLVVRAETVPLWFTLDGGTTAHGYFSTAGAFRVANGSVAAPPFAFINYTGTGFVPATGSHGGISVCETSGAAAFIRLNEGSQASWGLVVAAASHIGWNSTTIALGNLTPDVLLFRDGSAGVLAQRNGNNAQEHRIYAGNGSYVSNLKCVNESLTIAAAATTDSATSIPAGSIIVAVAVRVTTVIPTAATFTVTTATGGTTMNTAAVSTAAGTTDKGTAGGVFYQAAATAVRITPNLVPAAATGVVRLAIYYYDVVAPTS